MSDRDKPRSRNGYNKQYWSEYYEKNRAIILLKNRDYDHKNSERIAEYHKNYYLIHKNEMNRMQRERYRIRKNNK